MSLIITEPDIELYKDGFEKSLPELKRAELGSKLSDLIERIDSPLVIALDGDWGTGKSFFLKCWVGAHLKRDENTTQTVYFDAFAHDFLDDPLIALTGAIAERLEKAEDSGSTKVWKKAKKVAPALARTLLRAGVSIGTAGVVAKADELIDAAAESIGDDLSDAVVDFWKKEDSKRLAMTSFQSALRELTEPDENGEPTRKLVVVVDELDRCRPDYALATLEIIKHFFNVPNVHFVLGANMRALENSVRARYGDKIDAARYLQKFVSLTAPLRGGEPRNANFAGYYQYYRHLSVVAGFEGDWRQEWLSDYIQMIDHHAGLSLRDVEKLITLSQVAPTPKSSLDGSLNLFVGLLILKVIAPDLVESARKGNLSFDEVTKVLNIGEYKKGRGVYHNAHCAWKLATSDFSNLSPAYLVEAKKELFLDHNPQQVLRSVIASSFDTFVLPELL